MTELELLLMKVAGLSEIETKDLIKTLNNLDNFDKEIISKLRSLLMENDFTETDANDSIDLLIKLRSS
jgi:hypothetical protein